MLVSVRYLSSDNICALMKIFSQAVKSIASREKGEGDRARGEREKGRDKILAEEKEQIEWKHIGALSVCIPNMSLSVLMDEIKAK